MAGKLPAVASHRLRHHEAARGRGHRGAGAGIRDLTGLVEMHDPQDSVAVALASAPSAASASSHLASTWMR